MIAGLAVIAGWYAYAISYNHEHNSSTFLLSAAPWWKLSSQQRHEVTRIFFATISPCIIPLAS